MSVSINNNKHICLLPHLLLSKIVYFIDDNIDRICFSFACRRWYFERDKYLIFNSNAISIIDEKKINHFYLNSFKSIFIKSINQKSRCTLLIQNDHHNCYNDEEYDFHIQNPSKLETIDNGMKSNIYKIKTNIKFNSNDRGKALKTLGNWVQSQPNVVKLKNFYLSKLGVNSSSRNNLLMNITSLSLPSKFDEALSAGYFPPNLRSLKFGDKFDRPIKAGVLPSGLEKLIFGVSFDQALQPGVLPATLKSLTLRNAFYKPSLQVGSLPASLETLLYSGHYTEIEDVGVLPTSLLTLKGAPPTWIKAIRSLSNLRYLSIDNSEEEQFTIDLSDLPDSLQTLVAPHTLKSKLPTSIKSLDIADATYQMDEIFSSAADHQSQYRLDYLKICDNGSNKESLENLDIKELHVCQNEFTPLEQPIKIPFGVATLSLELFGESKIAIPLSVTKLNVLQSDGRLDDIETLMKFNDNNNSIKEMSIETATDLSRLDSEIIPESVETLKLITTVCIPQPRVPNNLILHVNEYETIYIRKLDNDHYIFFSQSPPDFLSAIVHHSQLKAILELFCN
ncbi:hypothetical protein PPL_01521 [Heterostelium album PN500]|uniref:COI1 F-box domain-containing protein n=1 Tax=Heterostelium pallidum (strain ATCC 26659 / Pp 5 / PN500) TaxID=670386 RepID=D3AZH9_HETP5|nr:hypothetical protein PPL_01521 [Heterostelium album PN500]EFA85562.1 hypothetical protein PPL_01521 [Heterostelium album PN500]|eukprot:XP_020437670.1 hypothetical protein PPL_01521 [Heterostelium album PN500]